MLVTEGEPGKEASQILCSGEETDNKYRVKYSKTDNQDYGEIGQIRIR